MSAQRTNTRNLITVLVATLVTITGCSSNGGSDEAASSQPVSGPANLEDLHQLITTTTVGGAEVQFEAFDVNDNFAGEGRGSFDYASGNGTLEMLYRNKPPDQLRFIDGTIYTHYGVDIDVLADLERPWIQAPIDDLTHPIRAISAGVPLVTLANPAITLELLYATATDITEDPDTPRRYLLTLDASRTQNASSAAQITSLYFHETTTAAITVSSTGEISRIEITPLVWDQHGATGTLDRRYLLELQAIDAFVPPQVPTQTLPHDDYLRLQGIPGFTAQ